MSNSININENNNSVNIEDQNRSITVTDNNTGLTANVTQDVTNVVSVNSAGPIGPIGPQGPSGSQGPPGSDALFPFIGDAQITGSMDINGSGGDIFLIKSSSMDILTVAETGAVTITNNAPTMFLIRDASFAPILAVSESGVVIFATQSVQLTGTAPVGAIYFTSSSLFVGLE